MSQVVLTQELADAMGIEGPKRSKYRNVKTVVDGITFDSKKEAQRWCELRLLEKAGDIRYLTRQHEFKYCGDEGKQVLFTYMADFLYWHLPSLRNIVEDVKPFDVKSGKFKTTPLYDLKKKLIEDRFGITITEV